MRERRPLDETDLEIVELLAADARRSFRDIADHVGLSAPAVSDRVDRLVEQGVIRRFTVDLDRSVVQGRTPVIIELQPAPDAAEAAYDRITGLDGVEHVFRTADGHVIAHATAPPDGVGSWLRHAFGDLSIRSQTVRLVDAYEWRPSTDRVTFALTCVVCGNDIGPDGHTATIDGEPKAFCCPSCEARYRDQYDRLTDAK